MSSEELGWIQLETKTSPRYVDHFVMGWSKWRPYLCLNESHGNPIRILTKSESAQMPEIPHTFGVYAIGILPPSNDVILHPQTKQQKQQTETESDLLESNILIVNHGVVGARPGQKNTLNKRLMSYSNKVKTHEWAFVDWMSRGFQTYVKWKKIVDEKESISKPLLASSVGALARKRHESSALRTWKFFLNSSEQLMVKGPRFTLQPKQAGSLLIQPRNNNNNYYNYQTTNRTIGSLYSIQSSTGLNSETTIFIYLTFFILVLILFYS